MFDSATPNPDLALQLSADAYWHLIRTLRLTLPPPPGDTPEDLLRRDHAAIARIAALAPGNAAEAELAAQFVAASEQWKDCLRLAQLPETLPRAPTRGTPKWAAKCRAQALSMMRQANSALRLLLRMQDTRRKIEADNAACDRLAWTEHCALGLMTEALSQNPHPDSLPQGEGEHATSPLPEGNGEGAAPPLPQDEEEGAAPPLPLGGGWGEGEAAQRPEPQLDPDLIAAAAERYAAAYPERAASIRRTGKLPSDIVYFDPPEAAIARALTTADTAVSFRDPSSLIPAERDGRETALAQPPRPAVAGCYSAASAMKPMDCRRHSRA